MGEHVQLRASDGFELDAYVARPEGEPIAGLVVVQEAFGVNSAYSLGGGWVREGWISGGGAGALRPHRAGRGVELYGRGYAKGDWADPAGRMRTIG